MSLFSILFILNKATNKIKTLRPSMSLFSLLFIACSLFLVFESSSFAAPASQKTNASSIKTKIFKSLDLKKGDRMRKLNSKPLLSVQSFLKTMNSLKKEDRFLLLIERNKRQILLTYKVQGKYSYRLLKAQKLGRVKPTQQTKKDAKPTTKTKPTKQSKNTKQTKQVKNTKPTTKTKQVKNTKQPKPTTKTKPPAKAQEDLKKYKAYLQKAYVVLPNSFVYQKPSFDSKKLLALKIGRAVIVSKKVYKPRNHNIGTFYKVIIEKPNRIVGYISQIESIPEFLKIGKDYKKNSCFKKINSQLKKTGQADLSFISRQNQSCFLDSDNNSSNQSQGRPRPRGAQYVGLFAAAFSDLSDLSNFWSQEAQSRKFAIGLQFNDKSFWIPYVYTDFHVGVYTHSSNYWYADLLFGYPLLGTDYLTVYGMAGASIEGHVFSATNTATDTQALQKRIQGLLDLSFVVPIQTSLDLRLDLRAGYIFSPQNLRFSAVFSLQRKL